ncbi:MAG: 4Fe-4S dicluster domain-containing protein [Synergistaceae bacterium]|jgi:ferredoxin|nr:4Fe-4S dicluster domain-containing protein [Synergistaceae bacterium]
MSVSAKQKRLRYRLLSWCRLSVALGILALFLRTFTSSLQKWSALRSALADTQFTGALMSGGLFSVVALTVLIVSALLGRWYCSLLCPLGTLQEVLRRAGARLGRKQGKYLSPWRLRYVVPALAGLGIFFALPPLFGVMDPISNFGRGVRGAYILAVEGAAAAPPVWAATGMFAVVLAFAALRGRRFCDWCPVGTLLGLFARVAPAGMNMNRDVCVGCGNCERACPMNCVDASNKKLDRDRCILCLSCAGSCAVGALDYGVRAPESTERRALFLKGFDLLAYGAGLAYLGSPVARGWRRRLVRAGGRENSPRNTGPETTFLDSVMPPGAPNAGHFLAHCIGCQACVAACPTGIIRTDRTSRPELDYTRGYCQYNCTECSHVCPAHALRPFPDIDEKRRTRIALSNLTRARCVVITRGESCGACAEVCPTHALRMEPLNDAPSLTAPVFDSTYCIGCGGCLNVCPADPKAFAVTGVTPQVRTPGMRPPDPEDEGAPALPMTAGDDFPF